MFKKIKPYLISILIALGVGGLSTLFTRGNMDFYETIIKPPLSPPMIVFPIVWGILFTLMGISSAMIYKEENNRTALFVYAMQLIVNFFWSIIFFNMQAFLFAFIWLILLWLLVIWMIYEFFKLNHTSAILQIPYLLWVTFAGYLNVMIYLLN